MNKQPMLSWALVSVTLLFFFYLSAVNCQTVTLDGSKLERRFDGIGGLSGGGATSRLLVDYPQQYQSQILDYLFKPNFGAALHILKVEIGGDTQTTDGTEPSHMHTATDLNFNRGYEWWLMVQAKQRNPAIKLYALSWGVPGWIGNGNYFSNDNIVYHINFLKGARAVYNLTIDYIGIWNERSYDSNWIKSLRAALDSSGFQSTQIVAADGGWDIVNSMESDPKLNDSISTVGVHYPGTTSPQNAQNLGKPLWASEDYSTYSDTTGGGCWARILNQNYVNGFMTATISWNLLAAYYNSLPFGGDGLMWAEYPWSGNYEVQSPIWISAHTTQFSEIGWTYLQHGYGVGHLPQGGSYVTLINNDNSGKTISDFSLVIETMTHDRSVCIRPPLPPYNVNQQTVTFQLSGGLEHLVKTKGNTLYVRYSSLTDKTETSTLFESKNAIVPNSLGQFTLTLNPNEIYTISTVSTSNKGSYPAPPAQKPFQSILPYRDDFNSYRIDSEAHYFMDQTGSWVIFKPDPSSNNLVMRQEVTIPPITWCGESSSPISLIGSKSMTDINITTDIYLETSGHIVLGVRVPYGGCGDNYANGYYYSLYDNGQWSLTRGSQGLTSGTVSGFGVKQWRSVSLQIKSLSGGGVELVGTFGGSTLFSVKENQAAWGSGWAAIGSGYNYAWFDNFSLVVPS